MSIFEGVFEFESNFQSECI